MADEGWCVCGPFRISLVPRGLLRPVLLHLLREGPRHGFELMEEIGRRTGGLWRPGPGAVYPALLSLEEEGFVTAGEEGERSRKPYAITEKGRKAIQGLDGLLEDWEDSLDRLEGLWRPG